MVDVGGCGRFWSCLVMDDLGGGSPWRWLTLVVVLGGCGWWLWCVVVLFCNF